MNKILKENLIIQLDLKLTEFNCLYPLRGLVDQETKNCLILQIIDSIRRVEYVKTINNERAINFKLTKGFNPLIYAVWNKNCGNIDEAYWLIFLSTHFGKNLKNGWRLLNEFYFGLGEEVRWDWDTINSNIHPFKIWLNENEKKLKTVGAFGNHHKYQSLGAYNKNGTGEAIESYINWIGGNHQKMIEMSLITCQYDKKKSFDRLYKSMSFVKGFGRMAKFDYLSMIGKIGLAPIEPGSAYIKEATGPKLGAKLLFYNNIDLKIPSKDLELKFNYLEEYLELHFGMQVLEDALCNWQKKPKSYQLFKG